MILSQGPSPTFWRFMVSFGTVMYWWLCHLGANVLQWVYNEAPVSLEAESSVILDLDGSDQFLSCPMMAPHSSTHAWKIPWMEGPGGLQSMGSQRVRRDWATSLSLFIFMHWGRKWQSTPVFLPGESQGRGSLVGCRLWGHTKLDMTEVT